MAAPAELDPRLTVAIGDLGFGSDAPIVLDYRSDVYRPCVRYLQWNQEARVAPDVFDNHWVQVANSFGEFLQMLDVTA